VVKELYPSPEDEAPSDKGPDSAPRLQLPEIPAPRSTPERVGGTTLRVIALSLILIVLLEALLLLAAATSGSFGSPVPFLIDLVEKMPWALFVCTGVWLGLKIGHSRLLLAMLAGLVAAPIGSLLLRAVAEGAHAFAFASLPKGPSPLLVAAIKGVEYACLGFLVGWLGRRTWAASHHHAAAGLTVGIMFGGVLLALNTWASAEPLDLARVMTWAVNELLFPVGCALILLNAVRAERRGPPGKVAKPGQRVGRSQDIEIPPSGLSR
jgi:hypothetical protein